MPKEVIEGLKGEGHGLVQLFRGARLDIVTIQAMDVLSIRFWSWYFSGSGH